ncbi:MAG: NAD(P)H-binding protein [Acidimicrobiia bacterium]|nr:NAD(P)H-binding protein [Acidimicrobiia bacterium]
MRVAIAGGHGQIALLLTRLLTDRGDEVRSLVRNPDHEDDVRAAGGTPVVADLEELDVSSLAEAVAGVDAVVFAAGAGPGSGAARKETVDYAGAVHLARAAAAVGIRRVVVISSANADAATEGDDVFSVYLRAKGRADDEICSLGLDHTIVRPVGLTDDPPTGRISTADPPTSSTIPRADVAAVVAAILASDSAVGTTVVVASGETAIDDAL